MKYTNKQNIAVISNFIRYYGNLLNEVMDVNNNITFLPLVDNPYNDPLIRHLDFIEYSEEICKRLDLSEMEVHAMIAHEIGHILDETNSERIPREIIADSMAQVLGLGKALVSGLNKLIESGLYPDENDIMKERIKILELNN